MNTEQLTSESWQEANNMKIRGIKTKPRSIEKHVITQLNAEDNERKEHGAINPHYKLSTIHEHSWNQYKKTRTTFKT